MASPVVAAAQVLTCANSIQLSDVVMLRQHAFSTLCELKDNGQLFKIAFAVLQLGGSRTGHVKARFCRCLWNRSIFAKMTFQFQSKLLASVGLRSFLVTCSGFDLILLS